ncbi:hypothetical protein Ddye_002338 [Dipteronia dyeriana]|uniref:Ubiquitin-conjugating enzyme E2 H n=1 Tax=Dipteronia dyeriana TaxID=168575 RepID=A0AAD9XQ80_9ROSI|nr:hypothetical protein Ddye_002338 [Dipteronia dyeriana]
MMMSDYNVETIYDGLNEFNVELHGLKESLCEGGVWKIHVELPDAYPYKSPSIGFVNKIYHPNVDEMSGSVCLDVINQSWSPMFDLLNIFEDFLPQLLLYPNPSDPLNGDAASLMMKDRKQYDQKVKGNVPRYQNWGWNTSSDPCNDRWAGVTCDTRLQSVRKIVLDGFNLSGTLDASSVCMTKSLAVLSLEGNNVAGEIPEEISNCKQLTHLSVSDNQFSGAIPVSLSQSSNLKRLDVSNNNLSGELLDFSRISGLVGFLAENNNLSGRIPDFSFSNLMQFNVSNNRLSGPIPDVGGRFGADSFFGNPGLCGKPLSNACPPTSPS